MTRKPPLPICKAFLVCSELNGNKLTLIGQSNRYVNHRFPNGLKLGFFARLTGGHGEYTIEFQLHDQNGEVCWRDGPPPWRAKSPLQTLEIPLHYTVVFPGPGDYSLVLTANGEELSREPFHVELPRTAPSH
jgi:hypothetical protein